MKSKPVFVIANDQNLLLNSYQVNSGYSTLTWTPDTMKAFIFYTVRRAERIKKQLEQCSCYPLVVLEAFWVDKTLQLSPILPPPTRFNLSTYPSFRAY